jgi:hypothetical protein
MTGNARKRPSAVDTLGLLLVVLVTGADVHDAVAGRKLAAQLKRTNFPRLKKIWVDSKYHHYALYAHIRAEALGATIAELMAEVESDDQPPSEPPSIPRGRPRRRTREGDGEEHEGNEGGR